MSETPLELDLRRDEVMRRAAAMRARLESTNPMWWLAGGVVAGALAARAVPRGGRKSLLAPAVAIVGAIEVWLASAAPAWLAQWRTPAAPEADAAPPADGPDGN